MALIKCPECGKQISDKAVTCPNCGIDVQKTIIPRFQYRYQPNTVTPEPLVEKRKAPFGGIALAMSIISGMCLFLFYTLGNYIEADLCFDVCSPIGLITGILGLVFSSKGLRKVKWNRLEYTSIATLVVGKVLSIVLISIWGLLLLMKLLFLTGQVR